MHPQVEYLLNLPQYEQRSPEWFEQRKGRLTSSDVDTALGNSSYDKPDYVVFKKCGISKPFTGNIFTRHGQKYEDEAIEKYCQLRNKKVRSFGLLPHPTISWLGGSPDDITEDGIVLEVKCPYSRKIEMGEVPAHYIGQIKMNLEICDLEMGVFIEYVPANFNGKGNDMILNIVEVPRDREWFAEVLPVLDKCWKTIMHYRKHGIETHPDYDYWYNKCRPKKVLDISDPPVCTIEDSDDDLSE